MPCNCDHMEPNRHEQESRKVAGFLVFIGEKLDISPPPQWVLDAANSPYGNADRVDLLTLTLCDMLTGFSDTVMDLVVYDARNPTSRRLADWWEAHQKADEEREKREKHQEERSKLIESGLSKLTPEERAALKI